MKLKMLIIGLSLFSSFAYSHVKPVFSVNEDPVCSIFEQSYNGQLAQGKTPSFQTNYIPIHKGGKSKLFTPDETSDIRVKFLKPIIHDDITWFEWQPLTGVQHKLSGYGSASRLTAVSSIKPAPNKSFVLQINTIGWRGPFYGVWIIEDSELKTIVQNMESIDQDVPVGIEASSAVFMLPDAELDLISTPRNIFQFNGGFYTVDKDGAYKLDNGELKTVCKLGYSFPLKSPQIQALENAGNATLMTEGITHIPGYYGTMGSSFIKVENGFKDAIEKPWLTLVDEDGMCFNNDHIHNCGFNISIENMLKDFASQDPWSYREVQVIRQHMQATEYDLSNFYIKNLKISPLIAQGMAKQAVYSFLGKTVRINNATSSYRKKLKNIGREIDLYTLDYYKSSIATNWFGKTELMWAAHFNDYDAIQRLLKKDDKTNPNFPHQALFSVTSSNDEYASVQYLNRSALTYAAENATLPVIQALIKAGSDINIKDSKGNDLDYYLAKNTLVNKSIKEIAAMPAIEIKPSFNCKLASSAQEKVICAKKGLAVYDKQMSQLYKAVRTNIKDSNIKALQRIWLKDLRRSCSVLDPYTLSPCMKSHYRTRIKYLSNLLMLTNQWGQNI
ncbi:hypothetical protein GCM10008107_20000 [Psychrosphaera saromensis]|uniref:Lysozyme inhibitor LprI-like N-terminal domain-containing protein n=1 Tax=Psychrosphaera saromensis TaxID=716813 RepID=A0A2S7UTU4_9GAMM|nr:ankyrin repeat domain-containing protein [Psychrosphaera saromensis]PQJ52701.1 hypothetical protein BTO11_02885 [Psychrosphaera saromensis]GHB70554.1 hypothetical protein GCM10008107_20000 [Psychrosphaera saromensis]GLQ13186.1 hypothetical protein GCM10007917_06410 [Psychrosphaera saromensis]